MAEKKLYCLYDKERELYISKDGGYCMGMNSLVKVMNEKELIDFMKRREELASFTGCKVQRKLTKKVYKPQE